MKRAFLSPHVSRLRAVLLGFLALDAVLLLILGIIVVVR
jgi:hypothetical protein